MNSSYVTVQLPCFVYHKTTKAYYLVLDRKEIGWQGATNALLQENSIARLVKERSQYLLCAQNFSRGLL